MRVKAIYLAAILAGAAAPMLASGAEQPAPLPPGVQERGVRVLEAAPPEPAPPSQTPPTPPAQTPPAAIPPAAPVIQFCTKPFDAPDLTTADAEFDKSLAKDLAARKHVVVGMAQPFPDQGDPPSSLSPWLSEVKAGGGVVTVKQYCEAARGALTSWLASIFGGKSAAGSTYRPARQYDVVMHADALDHVVTQVEFTPRKVTR